MILAPEKMLHTTRSKKIIKKLIKKPLEKYFFLFIFFLNYFLIDFLHPKIMIFPFEKHPKTF